MSKKTYFAAVIICVCFFVCGAAYVLILMMRSEKVNRRYLFESTERNMRTFETQIISD